MFFNYCHMRSCPLARVYVLRGRQIEPSLHRPPLPKLTRYFRKSAHNSLVMSQNEFSGGKSRRAPSSPRSGPKMRGLCLDYPGK